MTSDRVASPAPAPAGESGCGRTITGKAFVQLQRGQLLVSGGASVNVNGQDLFTLQGDALQRFPHEFSDGQRQPITIARALVVSPKLIVFDEPTSALNVSVEARILNLLCDLPQALGVSYPFITRHIAVVGYITDRLAAVLPAKAGQR